MNRGKSRLSLSRKRKKRDSDSVSDGVSHPIHVEANSKRSCNVEGRESQDIDQNNGCGKTSESAKGKSKETSHNSTKKGIAAWLKKPCSPKTVPCPMCGKVVFLYKINKHLDSNCESSVTSRHDDHLHVVQMKNRSLGIENGWISSDVQKNDINKGSVPVTKDGVKKSRECTVNGRFPQTKEELESLAPLNSSFSSDHGIPKDDGVGLLKVSQGAERNKQRVTNLNSGVTKGNSPDSCHSDGDSSDQGLYAKFPAAEIANSVKEHKRDGLQANSKVPRTNDLSKIPSNCVENVEALNENLGEENLETHTEEQRDYEPYYLANFKLVLANVLSNQDDRWLFNEQDNTIIDLFNGMSPEEQKLYIRLFQRKRGWFRCSKLEYPKICKDLKPVLDSLIQKGFLQDEHQLTNLPETLNLIAAPELKLLVKSLHISTGKKGGTKEDIIEAIVSLAENQKTLFGSFRSVVLKRAKQALGCCVRVAADAREVFNRVLLLFTMNVIPDDADTTNNGQALQLSMLFLANIGKVVYPAYVIERPTPVFNSRDSLITFAAAYQQKHEMLLALESNNFEHAYSYYPEASKKFNDILAKLKDVSSVPAALLPEHLRCFTAEWAITKMCYYGVEVLQKWRQYEEAVNQLEILLQQDVFCFDSRGRWYDRLALNLHQHLKRPEKAMEVIRQGLSDPHVRFGRHLALVQRAKRILSSPAFQKGKKKKCEEFADLDLKEPSPSKSITICGTRCAQLGVFIAPEIDRDGEVNHSTKTFCAVEEYALSYYRQQGYDQGIHGEGSTYSTLYCLFMWDIIFSSGIPDVFRSPFQAAPLDMCFDSYYVSRKDMIDRRLEQIAEASVEKLQEMLSTSWSDNEGQICVGLSWERFTDVEQAKQLVACLGGAVLSGIFARFAQGFRYHCSGLPDLVVWNSTTLGYRIAEVKGPGDKLSTKQQIWLEVLQSLGANVEVCYVTDIGAKRLKVSK